MHLKMQEIWIKGKNIFWDVWYRDLHQLKRGRLSSDPNQMGLTKNSKTNFLTLTMFWHTDGKIVTSKDFSYLREETFNAFPTKLNPQTVVHNWWVSDWFSYAVLHLYQSSGIMVQLVNTIYIYIYAGWVEVFVQRPLDKVSDAFSAIKGFGILTTWMSNGMVYIMPIHWKG